MSLRIRGQYYCLCKLTDANPIMRFMARTPELVWAKAERAMSLPRAKIQSQGYLVRRYYVCVKWRPTHENRRTKRS